MLEHNVNENTRAEIEGQSNEKRLNDFVVIQITVRIPNNLLFYLQKLYEVSKRTRNDLCSEFIIDELGIIYQDPIEQIVGYLGKKNNHKNISNYNNLDVSQGYEIFEASINIPEILVCWIKKFCSFTEIPLDVFLGDLIIARLELIDSEPEMFCTYINNLNLFLEDLRIGINQYYGKNYFKQNNNSK